MSQSLLFFTLEDAKGPVYDLASIHLRRLWPYYLKFKTMKPSHFLPVCRCSHNAMYQSVKFDLFPSKCFVFLKKRDLVASCQTHIVKTEYLFLTSPFFKIGGTPTGLATSGRKGCFQEFNIFLRS